MNPLFLIHFFQRTVIFFPLCFFVISINCYSADSPGEDTTIIKPLKKVDLGYLSISEEYYPGTASSLPREAIQPYHKLNFTGALAGQIPGLYVLTRSDEPGQEKYDMLVHGISSLYKIPPLIIIDGIPGRDLSSLNENDIESITVLKDAATVLYGTKASNGLILVTTRKGIKGKPAVSISFKQGIEVPTVLPEMADAPTYANMLNEAREYHGELPVYNDDEIRKFADGSDPWHYPNTNWVKKVCKSYVLNNSLDASLNGGSNKIKYYVSAGLKNQDGLFHGNLPNAKLKFIRANTEAAISIIRTGINLNYSQLTGNLPIYGSEYIFENLTRERPSVVASWPGGKPNDGFEYDDNLIVTTTSTAGAGERKKADIGIMWYAIADIPKVKGLSLNFRFAYDKVKDFTNYQKNQYNLYSWNGGMNPLTGEPELTSRLTAQKAGRYSREEPINKLYNAFINFEREIFLVNSIKMMIGYERVDKEYKSDFGGNGINNVSNYKLLGKRYFGLLHYGYRSKYLLDAAFGHDVSVHLPPKNSGLLSHSFAAAWLISKESFWKELFPQSNSLKLNMSWTKTGSDYYLENSSNQASGLPNPNLNWEDVSIYMLGIEASFFQGKLDLKADYFRHKHSNVFYLLGLPNYPSPLINSGKIINNVIEGMVEFKENINEFFFKISFNGSYSQNKVKDLDENYNGVPDYQLIKGHSVTYQEALFNGLCYQAVGIFKNDVQLSTLPHWAGAQPGDIIFKDVNNDGKIDGLDKVRVKNSIIPKFNGGLSCHFQYRQFDLNLLFHGVAGTSYYYQPYFGLTANYYKLYAEERWTKEHPISSYPKAGYGYYEYWTVNSSTFWLKDASFIRLKHIEAGYTFRQKLSFIAGKIRVYISASNLFKIDGTHLVDPEAGGNYYPIMRTFNLGIRFDLG